MLFSVLSVPHRKEKDNQLLIMLNGTPFRYMLGWVRMIVHTFGRGVCGWIHMLFRVSSKCQNAFRSFCEALFCSGISLTMNFLLTAYRLPYLPKQVTWILATSKVFMYPELLQCVLWRPRIPRIRISSPRQRTGKDLV